MCVSRLLSGSFSFCTSWTGLFEIESYREIFHLLIHSPDGCSSQVWARLKPGANNFIWVFHEGAGFQIFGSSSTVFPRILAGSWIGSGAAGPGTSTHRGCQHHGGGFTCSATVPAPALHFLNSFKYSCLFFHLNSRIHGFFALASFNLIG